MAEKTLKTLIMKKYLLILSAFVLVTFSSCNRFLLSDISTTAVFNIEGSYTELQVENAFNVIVSDTATQITVTTDENVMPYVVVEKVGDKLKIHLKPFTFDRDLYLDVILPFNPDLKKVDLSGASELRSQPALEGKEIEISLSGASDFLGVIIADEVDVELSGASDFEGNITANELDLELSGASDAIIEGHATNLNLELSGASKLKKKVNGEQYALSCNNCQGSISGSSEAYIHCDGNIIVILSGASDLHYTGDAAASGSTTTGASNIVHDKL